MKMSWFHHTYLTEDQAHELVARYAAKHVRTEKSLSPDYKSWTVSALLPEGTNQPRISRTFQQKIWH